MPPKEQTFCRSCDQLLPTSHLRRGGAIYSAGSWYCKQCCIDGTASGSFLTNQVEVSGGKDLAPADGESEVAELRRQQQLFLAEIDRLREAATEAEQEAADDAASAPRLVELEEELAAERSSSESLRDQLTQLSGELDQLRTHAPERDSGEEAERTHALDEARAEVTRLTQELEAEQAARTASDQARTADEQALEELRARPPERDEAEDAKRARALEEAQAEVSRLGQELEAEQAARAASDQARAADEQALEELRARPPERDEAEDSERGRALEEAQAEVSRLGQELEGREAALREAEADARRATERARAGAEQTQADLEATTSALRSAQRSEARLQARIRELLPEDVTVPAAAENAPNGPGDPEPPSSPVKTSSMTQQDPPPPAPGWQGDPLAVLTCIRKAIEYIGSTDFFCKPLGIVYLTIGVLNILFPLVVGYALVVGQDSTFIMLLLSLILLVAGLLSFELWRSRMRRLPAAAGEGAEFIATPLYAHFIRTTGEWIGLWIAIVGFLGGGMLQGATLVGLMDADELLDSPAPFFVMAIAAPIIGYLVVFSTRTMAETMSALTAVANNTRKD